MKTIFLVPGHSNHLPNLLRTQFIEHLAGQFRVVVLSVNLDESAAREGEYFLHPSVIYEKLAVRQSKLWKIFNGYLRLAFVREYDGSLLVRRWYYKPTLPIEKRFLVRLGRFLPRRLATAAAFTALENIFVRLAPEFLRLTERYKPSLVVTATPGFAPQEAEIIHYARRLHIPSLAVDMNIDNPETGSKLLRQTDYASVWSERMREEAMRYQHYPADRVAVTGCLRFDHYFTDPASGKLRPREEFLLSKNLDPAKKLIVYPTPPPVVYSYQERREIMTGLAEMKQRGHLQGDPNILVRLHPSDVWEPYADVAGLPGIRVERAGTQFLSDQKETKGWKTELRPQDALNLTEMLLYCDVMVGFQSTIHLEAAIFGKPVIGITFPGDRAWAYEGIHNPLMIRAGVLHLARDFEEVRDLLNRFLVHPESDLKKCREVVSELVYGTDGLAYQRTVDFIKFIVSSVRIPRGLPRG